MTEARKRFRCAIYTRKSTEHNLDLEFNSLDAQREACEAYIRSQVQEGWRLNSTRYDDGAFSGASLDRPALQELISHIESGKMTHPGKVEAPYTVCIASASNLTGLVKSSVECRRTGL